MFRTKLRAALIAALAFAAPSYAIAQIANPGVQQSGNVTANHLAIWGPGLGQVHDGGAIPAGSINSDSLTSPNATLSVGGSASPCTGPACAFTVDLPAKITGASVGSATTAPVITFDNFGRATAIGSATIAPPFTAITGRATLAQLPQLSANSIFINPTGALANPQAIAVPACANDGAHALVYINGTGLQCAAITAATVSLTPGNGISLSTNPCTGTCSITNTGVVSVTVQEFTTTGTATYTPHAGLISAEVECQGGGGGGGGVTSTTGRSDSGGGGSAGTYSRVRLTAAQIGASQTVTVGAGGAGGVGGVSNGQNGGATSFGTLCTAPAGLGAFNGGSGIVALGGASPAAGTGDISIPGAAGNAGSTGTNISELIPSAAGGNSMFGFGGASTVAAAGALAAGIAPTGFGAGGGSAAAQNVSGTANGAAGKSGIVQVTEYSAQ